MTTANLALAKARQLFGERAVVKDGGASAATTPAQRAEALAEAETLRGALSNKQRRSELAAFQARRRYQVGRIQNGGARYFICLGQGDTWDEAIADAMEKTKQTRSAA